jgi:hypothetical protein
LVESASERLIGNEHNGSAQYVEEHAPTTWKMFQMVTLCAPNR